MLDGKAAIVAIWSFTALPVHRHYTLVAVDEMCDYEHQGFYYSL